MDVLIKILFIILLNIFAEKGFHLDLNVQSQEENRISTAALIQVVTPLQTIGNTLYYGDIVIKLPDGITAEWKDPSLGNQFALLTYIIGRYSLLLYSKYSLKVVDLHYMIRKHQNCIITTFQALSNCEL